jgi:hypothetical protein
MAWNTIGNNEKKDNPLMAILQSCIYVTIESQDETPASSTKQSSLVEQYTNLKPLFSF